MIEDPRDEGKQVHEPRGQRVLALSKAETGEMGWDRVRHSGRADVWPEVSLVKC